MILEYKLSDNKLVKKDATMYPNHLQDNIILEFEKDEELPNTKYYAYIKTSDGVKKVRMRKRNGKYTCELPPFVSHYTFFKLQVLTVINKRKLLTNELIIPFNSLDYLDYNRTVNKILHTRYPLCDDDSRHKRKHHHHHKPDPKPTPTPTDTYNKEEIDDFLKEKANLIHKHQHDDVVDWEEEISEDLDLLLFQLTNKIREV